MLPPVAEPSIDIVYLWVDGNDPVWRAKRHRAALGMDAAQTEALAPFGNVEGRFRDNEELRYSLRALERFFPDHGHVYLVTDEQTPPWLRDTSRLTVVSHRDLLPADRLPTFDSGNIESYIHRIPGLSERYFYLNDDVFFGAPVRLDHWFWPGGFYAAWSDDPDVREGPMRPDDNSLENASRPTALESIVGRSNSRCNRSNSSRRPWAGPQTSMSSSARTRCSRAMTSIPRRASAA